MHERRALFGAAWRELWPSTALAIGLAVVCGASILFEPRSPWSPLLLLPAALYAGVASGSSTSRMLSFLLARPCRREQVFASRVAVSLGSLVLSWAIAAAPIMIREPDAVVLLDLLLLLAAVLLAFVCALVGATATEREPLALGIGALLFTAAPLGILLPVEQLEITSTRVLRAHPLGVLAAALIILIGFAWVVRRAWQQRLPLRDAPFVRRMLLDCGAVWVPAQLLCLALVWSAASAGAAVPLVVLGADASGLVIAGGSPSSLDGVHEPRIDAISRAGVPLFDATRRSELTDGTFAGDITRAAWSGGRLALTVDTGRRSCRVFSIADGGSASELDDVHCGDLSLSASGRSLAVGNQVIDFASGETTRFDSYRQLVGWAGDAAVTLGSPYLDPGLRVGERVLSSVPVFGAKVSRSGTRIASTSMADAPTMLPNLDHPTRVDVLSIASGASIRHELALLDGRVVEWLDDEHFAVLGRDHSERNDTRGLTTRLWIVRADSGELLASVRVERGLGLEHIDGPPAGPWVVTLGGTLVEAWTAGGVVLWREQVQTLAGDRHEVRRWAFVGHEVVGIDGHGLRWSRPLPWEVEP
jgi:hypothetical protein